MGKVKIYNIYFFFNSFCPSVMEGPLFVLGLYFMYCIGRMPGYEPELLRPQPDVLPLSYTPK